MPAGMRQMLQSTFNVPKAGRLLHAGPESLGPHVLRDDRPAQLSTRNSFEVKQT